MIRSLTVVMPAIFLLVAAFLVHMVLSRTIATQREQIGLLEAFGYTSGRIAIHYVEFALMLVLPGAVLGLPFGALLGEVFADFFGRFFRFPVLVFRIDPPVVLEAACVAMVAAALGAFGAVRRVLAMPPVVAMATEIPKFRRSSFERNGLTRRLRPVSRMVLRNLIGNPLRSVLTILGMALAVAVVMLGTAIGDAADRMRDVCYQAVERQDITVSFSRPLALGTAQGFRNLPGVRRAEPFRAVPARALARGSTQDVLLLGLPSTGVLRNPVDSGYRTAAVPREGAIITAWLAKRFGLRRGDRLPLEIRERQRRVVSVPIAGVIDESLGAAVYMELGMLGRLLGEPETYSGVNLVVDPMHERELHAVLKRTPIAVAVDFRRGALAIYRAMGDVAVEFVRQIEVVFGIIIAFGVVYKCAKIALAERSRELGTLRVLGFTRRDVSLILCGEIAALAAPAVPSGFVIGHWLSGVVMASMAGERMTRRMSSTGRRTVLRSSCSAWRRLLRPWPCGAASIASIC